MKDFRDQDRDFEVGHFAICEWPIECLLTKYRPYKILGHRAEEGRLVLTDDHGNEIWARSDRFLYFPYSEDVMAEGEHKTIDELMHEIAYSWDHSYWPSTLHRGNEGIISVNKLSISPFWTEYKGHYEKMTPGLYEYLCRIYATIEEARELFGKPKKFDGTEVEDV